MKNKTSIKKIQEILHFMHPEILYFGYFEDEKIVFEVGSLNFKNLEKWQIFKIFLGLDISLLRHSLQSKLFFS